MRQYSFFFDPETVSCLQFQFKTSRNTVLLSSQERVFSIFLLNAHAAETLSCNRSRHVSPTACLCCPSWLCNESLYNYLVNTMALEMLAKVINGIRSSGINGIRFDYIYYTCCTVDLYSRCYTLLSLYLFHYLYRSCTTVHIICINRTSK